MIEPDETPRCQVCGGVLTFLGTLGTLDHFRCRSCAAPASQPREPLDATVAELDARLKSTRIGA